MRQLGGFPPCSQVERNVLFLERPSARAGSRPSATVSCGNTTVIIAVHSCTQRCQKKSCRTTAVVVLVKSRPRLPTFKSVCFCQVRTLTKPAPNAKAQCTLGRYAAAVHRQVVYVTKKCKGAVSSRRSCCQVRES